MDDPNQSEKADRETNWRRPITARNVSVFAVPVVMMAGLFLYLNPAIARAKEFRAHPTYSDLADLLDGGSPRDIVTRYLIFRGGSSNYRHDLHRWVYQLNNIDPASDDSTPVVKDTWWNRWILEADLDRLTPNERSQALLHYPINLSRKALPLVVNDINAGHEEALIVLQRQTTDAGREAYRRWINDNLILHDNPDLFCKAGPYLVRSSVVPATGLFEKYWPILGFDQRNTLVGDVGGHLVPNTKATEDFFSWYSRIVERGEISGLGEGGAPFGAIIQTDSLREKAADFISDNLSQFSPGGIETILNTLSTNNFDSLSVAEQLYTTGTNAHAGVAIEAFHHVIHADLARAEALAKPVLSQPDSEIRKGTIVILVRHDSLLGKRHIDEAFTGSAPRTTMFNSVDNYAFSDTAQVYRRIAGHDYQETGKTWPPSRVMPGRLRDESARWRRFIDTYKWFPGTDDAYYRMGYSLYVSGDFRGAENTIMEYMHSNLPDNDARPFIMRLLQELSVKHSREDSPLEQNLRTLVLHPIGPAMFDETPNLEQTIRALDWFIADPTLATCLTGDAGDLSLMRSIARSLSRIRKEDRLQSIISMAGDRVFLLPRLITSEFFIPLERDEATLTELSAYTTRVLQRAQQSNSYGDEAVAAAEFTLLFAGTKSFASSSEIVKKMPEELLPPKWHPLLEDLEYENSDNEN